MKRLRRNDIVLVGSNRGTHMDKSLCMYGRVVKRVDDEHVLVIDCGKYFQVLPDAWLEKQDYQGQYRWNRGPDSEFPCFDRMPTLRKLKQITSWYNSDVWKKKGKPVRD